MKKTFSINDVHGWLGCDEEMGRRVWFDSNLYNVLPGKIVSAIKHKLGIKSDAAKSMIDVSQGCSENWPNENLYALALSNYMVVCNRMKYTRKKKKPLVFENEGKFYSYVKDSMYQRTLDDIFPRRNKTAADNEKNEVDEGDVNKSDPDNDVQEIPNEQVPLKKPEDLSDVSDLGIEYHEVTWNFRQNDSIYYDYHNDSTKAANPHDIIEFIDIFNKTSPLAQKLIDDFSEFKKMTRSLKEHLSFLRKMEWVKRYKGHSLNMTVFYLLNYISNEAGENNHKDYLEYAREQLGNEFNQSTWNSNYRRIKVLWKEFILGPGRPTYRQFLSLKKESFEGIDEQF